MTLEAILHRWGNWIGDTPVSNWLAAREWLIAASQSIHIVMLSIVFACALLINLRLLRVSATGRSASVLVRTLVPRMYRALLVLLITGTLQTLAEPLRQFVTPAFWAKMAMIVVAIALTETLSRSVRQHPERWNYSGRQRRTATIIAVVSIALWMATIACGRLIAYTWSFYA